jgi:hypothetical protein
MAVVAGAAVVVSHAVVHDPGAGPGAVVAGLAAGVTMSVHRCFAAAEPVGPVDAPAERVVSGIGMPLPWTSRACTA